ncbi:hypothetical protein HK102_010165, partial [Quaeritorhiza haematococci]
MDLVKAFTNRADVYQITVKVDYENPLFKAVDVARILGIVNVRDAIKDYDEDEKVGVVLTDGAPSPRVNFLTEAGLYRLILASKKPFAKQFRKWVFAVAKEIRLTGQYQLQRESEAKLIQFQQEKAAIEARATKAEAAKKEAEANAAKERRLREEEQKRREELEGRIKTKKYEAMARDEFVYIMKESSELHNNKHKIGGRSTSRTASPTFKRHTPPRSKLCTKSPQAMHTWSSKWSTASSAATTKSFTTARSPTRSTSLIMSAR